MEVVDIEAGLRLSLSKETERPERPPPREEEVSPCPLLAWSLSALETAASLAPPPQPPLTSLIDTDKRLTILAMPLVLMTLSLEALVLWVLCLRSCSSLRCLKW